MDGEALPEEVAKDLGAEAVAEEASEASGARLRRMEGQKLPSAESVESPASHALTAGPACKAPAPPCIGDPAEADTLVMIDETQQETPSCRKHGLLHGARN